MGLLLDGKVIVQMLPSGHFIYVHIIVMGYVCSVVTKALVAAANGGAHTKLYSVVNVVPTYHQPTII